MATLGIVRFIQLPFLALLVVATWLQPMPLIAQSAHRLPPVASYPTTASPAIYPTEPFPAGRRPAVQAPVAQHPGTSPYPSTPYPSTQYSASGSSTARPPPTNLSVLGGGPVVNSGPVVSNGQNVDLRTVTAPPSQTPIQASGVAYPTEGMVAEGTTGAGPMMNPAIGNPAIRNVRPRVGLVLGGGGAAGICHVGVLKVLEQHGIPIDFVAGTSMGSIVAGLYSTGRTAQELEQIVYTFPWDEVLHEPVNHDKKYERRKTDDYLFPPALTIGVRHGEAQFGSGLVSGQALTLKLRRLLARANGIANFDQLPIPFRAVGTDLETGQQVVFREGNLATAIRASMSIPGVFPPVRYKNRVLVDGGLLNNLPTDVAREMGADILIAVQLPTHLKDRDQLKDLFSISSQSLAIISANSSTNRAKGLRPGDILVRPQMNGISTLDFDRAREAVALGEAAMHQFDNELSQLSALLHSYGPIPPRRALVQAPPLVMGTVRLDNTSPTATELVESRVTVRPGEPFTLDQLERDIARIAGTENYGNVDYEFNSEVFTSPSVAGQSATYGQPSSGQPASVIHQPVDGAIESLTITTTEEPRGRVLLTLGVGLEDNFNGDALYSASAALNIRDLNNLGAEARLFGRLGSRQVLTADIFQPLEMSQTYFVRPYAGYTGRVQAFSLENERVADLKVREERLGVEAGRMVGDYGVISAGGFYGWESLRLRTGSVDFFQPFDSEFSGFALRAKHDSLDNYFLPRNGLFGEIEYAQFDENVAGAVDTLFSRVIAAKTFGTHTFVMRGEAMFDDIVAGPRTEIRSLTGGFLRLSGFSNDELVFSRRAQVAMLYMNRFASLFGDRVSVFYGGSIEYGYLSESDEEFEDVDEHIIAGSLFGAVETPLGPIFVGWGANDSDRNSAFIAMGQVF